MRDYYVPGLGERDQDKIIRSLQEAHRNSSLDAENIDTLTTAVSAAGDVDGPASSTDNALVRFDSTTGKIIQNSQITLGDSDGKLTRTAGISLSGTNTNDAAASGYVGELITSEVTYASRFSITTGTIATITTIDVTAGDWDVSGVAGFETSGGGVSTEYHIEISTTAPPGIVTAPNAGGTVGNHVTYIANQGQVFPVGPRQVSVSSTTTVYLKCLSTFTNSQTTYGYLRARRVR